MSNLSRKTHVNYGIFFQNQNWQLNVYIIQSDEHEKISNEDAYGIIEVSLADIENNCLSKEFVYLRTGFAFLHYGNRGVNLSIWHVGIWGKTYEIFNRTRYCYKRELDTMEVLDDAEPVLSQYEISLFVHEMKVIEEVIKEINGIEDFRNYYLKNSNVLPKE